MCQVKLAVEAQLDPALTRKQRLRLLAKPAQVVRRPPDDRQHDQRRIAVGMLLPHFGNYRIGEALARLDDHDRLLVACDFALPAINRRHTGKDVHAGCQAPLDEEPADGLSGFG